MVVGVDVHSMGHRSIIGMTASYNKQLTQYHSKVAYQSLHREMLDQGKSKDEQEEVQAAERTEIFGKFMLEAIDNFTKRNKGTRPEQIIIYRDGIGGPTMTQKVLKSEGPGGALTQAIKSFAEGYDPKLLFVFVDKKMSLRLFERTNGDVCNPGPGTIVDQGIVENDGQSLFDFFMIANNNPRTATAQPVHYSVVVNTMLLTKGEIEEITYHQCYNYYGFGGPIKVPACVKYAQMIATYTHDNDFSRKDATEQPNEKLCNRLHFL